MVTIIDFSKKKNQKGEEFNALVLTSGIELVKSHTTGRYYETEKKASIPSTFDEATCRGLIGTQIPGSIQRVESESFEFTVPSLGEVLNSSLLLAFGLGGSWENIAVIDTENSSSHLYSHLGNFNVLGLSEPFSPERIA